MAYDARVSTALARFLQRQLDARGVTADQFAKEHGLNSSGLYQLLRGERTYVQDRTLERLATALGMTLAQMVSAMAHTGSEIDPDEAEWVALIRQVPVEKRSAARDMLLGLAIRPSSQRTTNGRRDAIANGRTGGDGNHEGARRKRGHSGSIDSLPKTLRSLVAFCARVFAPSNAAYPSLPNPVTLAAT